MTNESLTFEKLQAAVAGDAAAIRLITRLEPAGGPGDKVFPPTYAGGYYATEDRRLADGQEVPCVVLDSVQSQANRFEEALLRAYDDKKLKLPLVVADFSQWFPDIGRITSLDAPHRIADAIFRDSLLNGKPFRDTDVGRAFAGANVRNATALFELCPTALIFGVWDSTGAAGGLGNKFARALASEIVGIQASTGVKTASRIDPLGIEKCPVYEDQNGEWTTEEDKAKRDEKGTLVLYGRNAKTRGKPSAINLGNVTPDIARAERSNEPLPGGVTISHAIQTTVLSLAALRRLRFPDKSGASTEDRNNAARTLLAGLALAAITLQRGQGYFLRSRCQLIPTEEAVFELVTTASAKSTFGLDSDTARKIFEGAVDEARRIDLPWREDPILLTPKDALVALVRKSRDIGAVEDNQ